MTNNRDVMIDKWHILLARIVIELPAMNHRAAQDDIRSCEGALQSLDRIER